MIGQSSRWRQRQVKAYRTIGNWRYFMSELSELYQQVILDHNKKPRNFRKLESANHTAEGYNPLCGDQLTIYLSLEDEAVNDISFEGSGCAISKAAASMMTQAVKGKSKTEDEKLFKEFHLIVT